MKLHCAIIQPKVEYDIEIGKEILFGEEFSSFLKKWGSRFAIVTDDTIVSKYGKKLETSLKTQGLDVQLFHFHAGEKSKNRATKERIEDELFKNSFGRDSCLIALGGGVVTDLAGFIAATYCRGIPFIAIPTSLLGMVDASIGGKTGLDVPFGKNLVGSIYQPKKVLIDTATLETLSAKERRNGIVEMIKHGMIANPSYFDFLNAHVKEMLELDHDILAKAIYESCLIKKEVVEEDEKEIGKRHLLNCGHTIGHALEKLTDFSLAHGEAVAIGLLVEAHMAVSLNYLSSTDFERIKKILIDYELPLALPSSISMEAILEAMVLDKKSRKGRPRFVMLSKIGTPLEFGGHFCTEVETLTIKQSLQWMYYDLCRH